MPSKWLLFVLMDLQDNLGYNVSKDHVKQPHFHLLLSLADIENSFNINACDLGLDC